MSETVSRVLKCDFCGITHDRSAYLDGAGRKSWFSIAVTEIAHRDPFSFIGDSSSPFAHKPRDPDLCSWECVAGYAQRKLSELAAQAEANR